MMQQATHVTKAICLMDRPATKKSTVEKVWSETHHARLPKLLTASERKALRRESAVLTSDRVPISPAAADY
jgi:hypothetical protein